MIFSSLEHTGKKPFSTVFIHGLVRDAQGRKMSKSLGNGIDPLEIIDKYGADALRYALATGNSPGNDMRFSDEKIEAARNFANKLWNASRFVRMNLTIEDEKLPDVSKLAEEDKWLLSKYEKVVASVNSALENFEIGVALSTVYDFTWDVFCDWYVELSKARLSDKESAGNEVAQRVILHVLTGILKLLHPFMPFITEEIYLSLPHNCESIMISDYPEFDEKLVFPDAEANFETVLAAIKAIRARRADMNVLPSRKSKVYIATKYAERFGDDVKPFFVRLASASEVIVGEKFDKNEVNADNAVQIVTDAAAIFLPLSDLVDTEKEKARLAAEKTKVEADIARLEGKLSNESFVAKAPAAVVDAERAKLAKAKENLAGIIDAISKLK